MRVFLFDFKERRFVPRLRDRLFLPKAGQRRQGGLESALA
jgi:hypothetical protein